MRENYSGNKRRREEAKRKKQEEKRAKRFNKTEDAANQPPAEVPPQSEIT